MAYTLVYHPEVKTKDVPALNRDVAARIQRAIENRLAVEPQRYGEPLRRTLKGYWKLGVGDYRAVFSIVKNEVSIFAIMHRRDVYQRIETPSIFSEQATRVMKFGKSSGLSLPIVPNV